jgi:tetratricopeptide (TPR) repeat protein
MRFKYFLTTFAVLALLVTGSAVVSAQVGQLRGSVEMKQADGTVAPLPGAVIDVFRTDVTGHYETKTDKKGNYVFAGLPFVGTYIVAASAPGAAPATISGVKAGREQEYKLSLTPGPGNRLSEAEVKQMDSGPSAPAASGGKESAEDRAKREELIKKNAEIQARNDKNKNINETLARTFKAGNEALKANNYDAAIAAYDEGLAADPEQPAILTNKAIALKARGVTKFNNGVKTKNDADVDAGKKDFKEAAETMANAVKLVKAQPAPTDPAAVANYNANKIAALATYADAMRLYVTNVDKTKADEGTAAFQEYIAAETDPKKKAAAEAQSARILFDAGQYDKAMVEYKKILAQSPDDPDALVNSGLALFNIAYSTNDKAQFQEAANYLQRFIDKAPDTHPLKADAKAVLDNIKAQQNIKPEPAARGKRRG